MKTKKELEKEVSILKDRLSKAVIFEVTEDITIGLSDLDGLFRIRRTDVDGDISFLNKNWEWEKPATYIDLAYSQRTGYDTIEEAFEVFDFIQNYGMDYDIVLGLDNSSALKNN